MPISYRVIGRHIREARQARQLTQEALAEKVDMSTPHLGKIERGERTVNLARLSQFCAALNVPIETLLAGAVQIAADVKGPVANNSDFINAMAELSNGCSEHTLKLMLRLCRDVAEAEK